MIAVNCSNCQTKLMVKKELVGKKVRCPQCKQPVEIPASTVAMEPARPALPSFNEDATVPPRPPMPMDAGLEPTVGSNGDMEAAMPREALKAEANYEVGDEIARGGMGAILRAVDQDIRREVAVKFLLHQADAKQKARFVEEAQITGQLEHPNIVPIHQLGVHADGRCFFSMKMVKGRSLSQILKDEASDYTLGRLLTVLVSICNAIAYAHSRKVIHRDLKPANIMVGDFGEVYVMDWGLAKVLGQESGQEPNNNNARIIDKSRPRGGSEATEAGISVGSKSGDKVTTYRTTAGDLTQAGAIMGTPAYMPPEQALGENVDERADIYSLGAILYEIMTLTPPVGRGGDMVALMMRVVVGQIDPPRNRAPLRAREGWVPPELSAVALKALAKERHDRFQTVDELKHDIELYLEGRSVSAKQDTAWEMFKKLVKRNMGASIATAAAFVVLVVVVSFFLKINYNARLAAEKANKDFQDEQQARRDQGKASAPSFLEDARHSIVKKKLDYALSQLNVALEYDPDLAGAWLLKGQLLIGQKKFAEARASLRKHLEQQPGDADAKKLVELCTGGNLEELDHLMAFADTLTRQKAFVLAEVMMDHLGGSTKTGRQRLAKLYQERLAAAWPGAGTAIGTDGTKIWANLSPFKDLVTDLTPLEGMKLNELNLNDCQVVDLTPLKGMPLTSLTFGNCFKVTDLTPLQGMKLTYLNLGGAPGKVRQIRDLSALRGMKLTTLILIGCMQLSDLSPLEGMPLERLTLLECPQISELAPLRGMPLAQLDLSDCKNLTDLSPLRGMNLTTLALGNCPQVRDLAPLEGMKLTTLNLGGPQGMVRQLSDVSPLLGMKLSSLNLTGCVKMTDLVPLRGMKLTNLNLSYCKEMSDLTPLTGMPLTYLDLIGCARVKDLTPLEGMPLTSLLLQDCTEVRELAPLQGMKLNKLDCSRLKRMKDLSPLKGMPLNALYLTECEQVQDLTPLQGMPLASLYLSQCKNVSDLAPCKDMKLTRVYLDGTKVTDLSPLAGMELTQFTAGNSPVRDLTPLKGMPLASLDIQNSQVKDLAPLRGMPLKSVILTDCKLLTDVLPLGGMTLESLRLPPTVTKGMEIVRKMSSLKTIDGKPPAQFWKEHDARRQDK